MDEIWDLIESVSEGFPSYYCLKPNNYKSNDRAGLHSAVGSVSDFRARGLGFDTWSGHQLSFLISLIQEGQLPVTGGSMCTYYWLNA